MPERLVWFQLDGSIRVAPPTDIAAYPLADGFEAARVLCQVGMLAAYDSHRGVAVTSNGLGEYLTPAQLVEITSTLPTMRRQKLARQCWGIAIRTVEDTTVAGPPAPSPDDIESTETVYQLVFEDGSPPAFIGSHNLDVLRRISGEVKATHHIEEQQLIRTKWRRTNA